MKVRSEVEVLKTPQFHTWIVPLIVQVAELYRVIEEQNKTLCSLKELANRNQLQQLQVGPPHKAQFCFINYQAAYLK